MKTGSGVQILTSTHSFLMLFSVFVTYQLQVGRVFKYRQIFYLLFCQWLNSQEFLEQHAAERKVGGSIPNHCLQQDEEIVICRPVKKTLTI